MWEGRFWEKIDVGNIDTCWKWKAGRMGKYGNFWRDGKSNRAHKIAFELSEGKLANKERIKQLCGDYLCCNPFHMMKEAEYDNRKNFHGKYKKASEDECWEWQAGKDKNGYGKMQYFTHIDEKRKKVHGRAHRIAYCLDKGINEVPDEGYVLHHCDNPSCVNPKHLYLGDNTQNVNDRVNRQRGYEPKGELHHYAKMTEEDVKMIRKSKMRNCDLARMFNVTDSCIFSIRSGRTWKHVSV